MERPADIGRILGWPAVSWSPDETVRVAEYTQELSGEIRSVVNLAEREDRNLNPDERETYDALEAERARCLMLLRTPLRS